MSKAALKKVLVFDKASPTNPSVQAGQQQLPSEAGGLHAKDTCHIHTKELVDHPRLKIDIYLNDFFPLNAF
jgi:hypothetical protein